MLRAPGGLSGITGGLQFDTPELLFSKFWPLSASQTLQAEKALKSQQEGKGSGEAAAAAGDPPLARPSAADGLVLL